MSDPHDDCPQDPTHDERLALPIESGVLLWCMRMLVVGMKRGIAVDAKVGEMLDALGAEAAAANLRSFMVALSGGCTRVIEVCCVCQKRLAADERALLDVLSLTQAGRCFEALLLLRGFVTGAGADAALESARQIGSTLALAGQFLPEPEEEVRYYALSHAVELRPVNTSLH